MIYRLPLVAIPTAADPAEFHRYAFVPGEIPVLPGPDGIAFGKSGKLYVALAGTSQGTDGSEGARYSRPAAKPDGSTMPWANRPTLRLTITRARCW